MVEYWSVFRKMWRQYYLRRTEELGASEAGAEEGGEHAGTRHAAGGAHDADDERESANGSAAGKEGNEGLGLLKSDWLKYVGECQENGNEVPHLRLFDGGTWHSGQGECSDTNKCQELGILKPRSQGQHMPSSRLEACACTWPATPASRLQTCFDHSMRVKTSVLRLPGRHAIGPHGGVLDWQLVTLEEDLYEMLCVALKCQGKLDKGDITLDDGTCESVLLLNVAVFRMHCNVWDIEVDQGGKTVTHVSGLPGVCAKDPDSASDFGYTHNAEHAV
jgi:hypothetical protein